MPGEIPFNKQIKKAYQNSIRISLAVMRVTPSLPQRGKQLKGCVPLTPFVKLLFYL